MRFSRSASRPAIVVTVAVATWVALVPTSGARAQALLESIGAIAAETPAPIQPAPTQPSAPPPAEAAAQPPSGEPPSGPPAETAIPDAATPTDAVAPAAPAPAPVPAPQLGTPSPEGQAQPTQAQQPGQASPAPATNGAPPPANGTPPVPDGVPVGDPAAEAAALEEIRLPVGYLVSAIESLEQSVEAAQSNDEELVRLRVEIDAVNAGADLFLESLQPRYQTVNSQIKKLGPAPAADQPAEAPALAAERARLERLSAEIDGAIKATGLVQYRARELLTKVQAHRASIFTSQLFKRSSSPLSLDTWRSLASAVPAAQSELQWSFWRWRRAAQENLPAILGLLLASVAIYLGLARLRRSVFERRLDAPRAEPPDFFERAGTAGWVASLLVLPSALAATVLALGLDSLGLWFLDTDRLALTLLPAFVIFIAVRALARAILQPKRPDWRLVDLADGPAASLASAVTWIGAIYAIDQLLTDAIRILAMPLTVSVAVASISSVALAALLVKIVATRFTPVPRHDPDLDEPSDALSALPKDPPHDVGRRQQVSWWTPRILKFPLLAVAVFILGASLAGYVALGRFVAGQVIVTGSLVILVVLLHLAIRALVGEETQKERALGRVMHDRLGLDDGQSRTLTRLAALLLDGLLALVALPFILVTWGIAMPDTLAWLKSLLFGFEIGQVRISLAEIAAAVALFAALLFLTRIVQRWIHSSFLTTARIDPGVANSIHKAIGYAGFSLAVLLALSYAGLDITNLAIVAGALSVGIGFGLQSIVNNFVSGLILLIERPIKVGDLVVVNNQWGRVRNIAVRATEIETADRASLIVPNSELISTTVTNWTHRNALFRVTIRVSVGYDSDPEQVRDILQQVAAKCPEVLQQPPPDVLFENFGASGLDFALHTIIPDVSKGFATQTYLRTQILREFRAAGIEIPFNQTDVHLRDLDFLKPLLARVQDVQAKEAANLQDAKTPPDPTDPKPKAP